MRKRRWFQIHLSTAILLSFVVGGLLWANLTPTYGPMMPSGRDDVRLKDETWGWPVAAYGRTMLISNAGDIHRPPAHWYGDPSFGVFTYSGTRNYDAVIADVIVAMLIFGAVAGLSEYLIARRDMKSSQPSETEIHL